MSIKIEQFTDQLHRQRERDDDRNLLREIVLPNFSGNLIEDAEEFLCDIEHYLRIKKIPTYFEAKVIGNAMRDNAKVWFNAVKNELQDFADFCDRIRAEFLSEEVQDRVKEVWRSRKYIEGNVLNYFYARVAKAGRFHPPLSPYKVHKTVVFQYPREIQFAMVGVDLADKKAVVRAIAQIEDTRLQSLQNANSNSWQHRQSERSYQDHGDAQRSEWRSSHRGASNQDASSQSYEKRTFAPSSSQDQHNTGQNQNSGWRNRRENRGSQFERNSRDQARGSSQPQSMASLEAQGNTFGRDEHHENVSSGSSLQNEYSENSNATCQK